MMNIMECGTHTAWNFRYKGCNFPAAKILDSDIILEAYYLIQISFPNCRSTRKLHADMQSVIVSTVKSCKKLQNDLLSFSALTIASAFFNMQNAS